MRPWVLSLLLGALCSCGHPQTVPSPVRSGGPPAEASPGVMVAALEGQPGQGMSAAELQRQTLSVSSQTSQAAGESATRRMVVKTGHLELSTRKPDQQFQEAVRMVKEMGGYAVSSHHTSGRSVLTARVPAERFEEAMAKLAGLGEVDRREVTGEDVTAEYVDVNIRLQNAERMRDQYLELLKKSVTVADAVAVQRELERVTTTIEQLRGRVEFLRKQAAMSTIELTLQRPSRPGPVGWIFYGIFRAVWWLFVWD